MKCQFGYDFRLIAIERSTWKYWREDHEAWSKYVIVSRSRNSNSTCVSVIRMNFFEMWASLDSCFWKWIHRDELSHRKSSECGRQNQNDLFWSGYPAKIKSKALVFVENCFHWSWNEIFAVDVSHRRHIVLAFNQHVTVSSGCMTSISKAWNRFIKWSRPLYAFINTFSEHKYIVFCDLENIWIDETRCYYFISPSFPFLFYSTVARSRKMILNLESASCVDGTEGF